jgi:hypothetical protein
MKSGMRSIGLSAYAATADRNDLGQPWYPADQPAAKYRANTSRLIVRAQERNPWR